MELDLHGYKHADVIDKLNHFWAGGCIAGILIPHGDPLMIFGIVLLAAVLKEIADHKGYGKCEALDIAATVLGGVIVIASNSNA